MATLPTPGGDTGTWGDELNEFIRVSHLENGNVRVADGQRLYFGSLLDTSIYRDGAASMIIDAGVWVTGYFAAKGVWGRRSNPTEVGLASYVDGDAADRFQALANGQLNWGTGGTTPDTNLYRLGPASLKTDGGIYAKYGHFVDGQSLGDVAFAVWLTGGPGNRFEVYVDGKHWWGSGSGAMDANLYREDVGVLRTNSAFVSERAFWSERASVTDVAFGAYLPSDATDHFEILADGKHLWGTGAGAHDTNLYRSAANTLFTDDQFGAQGQIVSKAGLPQQIALADDGRLYFGTALDTNLYRQAASILKTDGTFDAGALRIAGVNIGSVYQALSAKGAANGYASLDGSGQVPDAQISAAIARDAEVTSAISTHAAAADPHTVYQKESEKAVANGYASLDGSGKVPTAQLPALGGTATMVTSLPGSPSQGQQALLVDSLTAPTYAWLFQYESGISDAYKWVCIGGGPIAASAGSVSQGGGNGQSDLGGGAPSLILPRAGYWRITSVATVLAVSPAFGQKGTVYTVVNGVTRAVSFADFGAAAVSFLELATTASQVLKQQYGNDVSGSCSFSERSVQAQPVRVA